MSVATNQSTTSPSMIPSNIERRFPGTSYLLWCTLLVALLYGGALRLPFFFDDFVHLPYVDNHHLVELWQTAGELAYYRPVTFTIWKLMFLLLGQHSALLQHGFNLLIHLVNGLLVGCLAIQLWRDQTAWRAYLSATLYLLFPFSYQAVPWIGALSHPLVTCFILLSLAAYVTYTRTDKSGWQLLSLLLALLAPFTHENGLLIGPLVAAIELTRGDFPLRKVFTRAAFWSIPALLWFPIWWTAPKAIGGQIGLRSLETIGQNSAYFLQGLAYPLTWVGGWLRLWSGWGDIHTVLILSLSALGFAAVIQWQYGRNRRSLLPWLWYGLAALPAVLFLSFDYVINGPRLLTLGSVAAAWLWADVALALARGSRLRQAVVAVLLFALLVQNGAFIRDRMGLHQLLGAAYRATTTAGLAAAENGETAIFVNHPSWLAPPRATYALGHEGVLFWPDYARPEALVAVPAGQPADVRLVRVDAIRPEMPYFYGVGGQAPDWPVLMAAPSRSYITRYTSTTIGFDLVARSAPLAGDPVPEAQFLVAEQPAVTLLAATATAAGDTVVVELVWRAEAAVAPDVTVFVHLLGPDGLLLTQVDGDPVAGSFPFWQWPAGTAVAETRYIRFEQPVAELDRFTLRVGLYDRAAGERLEARTAAGESLPDNALTLGVSGP